jgi:hypothetical protein
VAVAVAVLCVWCAIQERSSRRRWRSYVVRGQKTRRERERNIVKLC